MTNPDEPETQGSERAVEPADVTAAYPKGGTGEELVRVLDEYLADLEAGRAPSREKLFAEHPALVSQLEPCLSGIEFIHRAARPVGDTPSRLGDFEIVREVGRGGMGVVYEAQQLSLKRKVALKVLRFAGVADRDAMERFQREAETVAQLHHTNIVPIFAIGEQKGVFYYAMQFIEGRSLAAVLEQSQKETAPLNLVEAASWTLQAAEALAHAHQRKVIHRDVKPSNLILDPAGQVWLTDFGLAKRMDDATLSMTGALLGTPRYMSPEQASAAKQPVDQRTDIYSLGATLYELATGKPLFDADSPHGIISQILTTEPPSPRKVRSGLPRDLETIILKCLAKEPQSRYATAQSLVDDLRAFCEGRAIKARRAGIAERMVRWVRTRKKNVAIAAIAAAATLVVAIVSYATFRSISDARRVHFSVAAEADEHFKVEVLDEAEKTTVATFTAPTQEAQVIPPGRFHVRLSRAGQLSETSQFEAAIGGSYNAIAALSPRNLWEVPIAYGETVETARLDGRDDVLLANQNELRRLHGATGQPIWHISLAAKDQPLVEKVFHGEDHPNPFFWPNIMGGYGDGWEPPCLVRPLLNLDNGGTPTLIWASRSSATLVAVSGKSGKVLWCHECRATLPDSLREDDIARRQGLGGIVGTIVGQPLVAEVGGKKIVASLCALNTEMITKKDGRVDYRKPQLWLDAVDVQSGEALWRRRFDWIERAAHSNPLYAATIWKQNRRTIGVMACENWLFGFDMLTGEPVWRNRELGTTRPLAVRFAELRSADELGVLLLRETPLDASDRSDHLRRKDSELRVTALSPLSATPLWERRLKDVEAMLDYQSGRLSYADCDCPLLVDLDGKGKPMVVIPFVDYDANSCGVEVLDGSTGATQWQKRLSAVPRNWRPPQPERIVLAPDLDGDGYRELVVASYDEEHSRVYVDALSGGDGRILWSNQQIELLRNQPSIRPMKWWQPGRDGWPLLVISYGNSIYSGMLAKTSILNASTGQVEHSVNDFGTPDVCDLNGDGLPDMLVVGTRPNQQQLNAGTLRAVKGIPPASWRVIGRSFVPGADFNGDRYADLLSSDGVYAVSGRDAATLWQSSSLQRTGIVSQGLPEGDLNGDGIPDVLSIGNFPRRQMTVIASSGRNGKALWNAEVVTSETDTYSYVGAAPPHLAGHILEAGKQPDVLLLYQRQRYVTSADNRSSSELLQTRLVRLSGQDGRTVWEQGINEFGTLDIRNLTIPFASADFDGDGVKDIVFWLPMSEAESRAVVKENQQADPRVQTESLRPLFELRAYSGRDGKLLWHRPGFFTTKTSWNGWMGKIPTPVICDPRGDGHPLVLVADQVPQCLTADRLLKEFKVILTTGPGVPPHGTSGLRTEVLALDGISGRTKWSWCGERVSLDLNNGPLESAQTWRDVSPQVVRTAAGPVIVVSAFDDSLRTSSDPTAHSLMPSGKTGNQIVTLNTRGEVLQKSDDQESAEAKRLGIYPQATRPQIWVRDLTGDGQDIVVWCDGRRVRARRPVERDILWESQELPVPLNWYIYGIQPAGKGYPATIAVGNSSGMIGLAGPTGKIRWRCDAEGVQANSLMESDDPQGLPRIWTNRSANNLQTSYQALATDDRGNYVSPKPAPRQYDGLFVDRRLLRPLPWAQWEGEQDWSDVYVAFAICIVAAASIIGWWSGKLRRSALLVGFWLFPWWTIEIVRFVLDALELGPGEHFDWSTFWTMSIQDFRKFIAIFIAIVLVWWLGRVVRWSWKKVSVRVRQLRTRRA